MKIIYIIRQELQVYPPCLTQIQYINDFGVEVMVVYGGCNEDVKKILDNKGIKHIDLNLKRKKKGYFDKIKNIFSYRKKAKKILKQYYKEDDFVWFGTADSAFLLKGRTINKTQFIMTVLELYDDNKFYRNNIGKIIHKAKAVLCCEKTRAQIMKLWWNLKKEPYVLPNKPYEHPMERNLSGTLETTSNMISKMRGEIGIIYQGIFTKDRNVGNIARALNELDQDIVLYLMGNDSNGSNEEIKKIYNKTIFLGFAPAPFHLEVTSYATIGIALYDGSNMNNLFCAPNKIYEYAGFGIPILGSDIPGLRCTVGKWNAGKCVDFDDIESIKSAIADILNDYDLYSQNAKKMFSAVDNKKTIRGILEDLAIIRGKDEL